MLIANCVLFPVRSRGSREDVASTARKDAVPVARRQVTLSVTKLQSCSVAPREVVTYAKETQTSADLVTQRWFAF